jgi:hypothetical protein
MDMAVLLGGFAISVCQAMDPDHAQALINSLFEMADNPSVSSAEAFIFRSVADVLKNGKPAQLQRRPAFTVIQGGAA